MYWGVTRLVTDTERVLLKYDYNGSQIIKMIFDAIKALQRFDNIQPKRSDGVPNTHGQVPSLPGSDTRSKAQTLQSDRIIINWTARPLRISVCSFTHGKNEESNVEAAILEDLTHPKTLET